MSDTMATPSHEPGPAPPVVAGGEGAGGQPHEPGFRLKPTHLAYLMGPVAFVALLLLMRFHLIVHESVWLWVAVCIAVPATSLVVNHLYSVRPSRLRLHLRIAPQAAGVTAVIYLTWWGAGLSGA